MKNFSSDHSFSLDEEKPNFVQEEDVFIFPTSFAQQRLWFLHQLVPQNPFYNVSTALRLIGALNISVLEKTFNEIVRRHEILRTQFIVVEQQPVQAIRPHLTLSLPVIDLQNIVDTEREIEAKRLAIEEAKRPFDLANDPLLRITLLQLDQTDYVLLLNLHHIIADGWSVGVLIRELGIFYTALIKNQPAQLPELPIQYADFSEWQREFLQGEILDSQLSYWRQQLASIPTLNLPIDRNTRPAIATYQGACQSFSLNSVLTHALTNLSRRQEATLFMTLLAAFKILLYRYTQQKDIAIGSPIANRNRQEIEGLIGFFVNSLVLRTNLESNLTFLQLLERVKTATLAAYSHQDLPFEKLVEELQPERDLSKNPLFQVSFSLQNTPIESLKLPDLTLSLLELNYCTAKLDLEVNFWQDQDELKGQFIYSTDLFEPQTITRMIGHFQTLLEGIIAHPEQLISKLPILTEVEQKQLLMDWNHSPYSGLKSESHDLFHHLFEQQAKQTPNAIALIYNTQSLTYQQLNNKANQLAHYLQQFHVKPDQIIGICIERSVEMIIGLLAILKTGGAYLPLDPTYPSERLQFMIEDAQVSLILTYSTVTAFQTEKRQNLSIINLDSEWNKISPYSCDNLNINLTLNHLAYVIYTSGSTGQPKGVLIEHRGLTHLIQAQKVIFNIEPSHRILQFASLSFDASIFEIVMALATGATLYLASQELLLPGQNFIQFLQKNLITHATLPPAVLSVLPEAYLSAPKTIIAAGEPCSAEIVNRWGTERHFFNAYGPTEATVWSTVVELNSAKSIPPIGRPVPNTEIYVLDPDLQPVPIGISGEIYIGGEKLARGYLNRPHLTTERFISHPFAKGKLLYKTGDLARYQADGNLEFMSRIDQQVKIRGFRIELTEIEVILRQHSKVKEAVALPWQAANAIANENQQLIAYLVLNCNLSADPEEFRNFLKQKLPSYMIPSAFIFLDALPLTINGKIDRLRLGEAHRQRLSALLPPSHPISPTKPRTEREKAIAKIWTEVLHLEQVGIDQNFFEVGGNSLLAVRLMAQINQQFQQKLPVSSLFVNPTISSLSAQLTSEQPPLSCQPPLVPIQPLGTKPPFFCIHPIFGVVFPYYELAFHLGFNQPFYGVQPVGLEGKSSPLNRIEDMAACYIQALRTIQPNGPYFIGGWSFGGIVAFEIAQQLLKAGDEVALLAIFDTPAPLAAYQPSGWETFKFVCTTVVPDLLPFWLDYFKLLKSLTQQPNSNNKTINFQALKKHVLNESALMPILKVYQANCHATLNYSAQVYPGKVTLFKSNQDRKINALGANMGWHELATGGVEVHSVPGNHLNLLRKPNVDQLVEKLSVLI